MPTKSKSSLDSLEVVFIAAHVVSFLHTLVISDLMGTFVSSLYLLFPSLRQQVCLSRRQAGRQVERERRSRLQTSSRRKVDVFVFFTKHDTRAIRTVRIKMTSLQRCSLTQPLPFIRRLRSRGRSRSRRHTSAQLIAAHSPQSAVTLLQLWHAGQRSYITDTIAEVQRQVWHVNKSVASVMVMLLQ